jgi:plastocyanin
MIRTRRWVRPAIPFTVLAITGLLAGPPAPSAQTPARVIPVAAVELKGGAQQDKEPYPTAALPAGAGYVKTPPNASGRWEVSAYQWSPGTVVVREGEAVTLEILGVNGDVHPSSIPGVVDGFVVKRGEVTRVSFTAGKPGLYAIVCAKHGPSMQGTLVVLPK